MFGGNVYPVYKVGEAAEGAADAATEEAAAATEEAAGTAAAEGGMDLSELLTAEGFDAEQIVTAIESSELGQVQKTALTAAVNQAAENPELVEATLTRLKEALGVE